MDLTSESSRVTYYSKSSLDDPLSPFFTHHFDNPGVCFGLIASHWRELYLLEQGNEDLVVALID